MKLMGVIDKRKNVYELGEEVPLNILLGLVVDITHIPGSKWKISEQEISSFPAYCKITTDRNELIEVYDYVALIYDNDE